MDEGLRHRRNGCGEGVRRALLVPVPDAGDPAHLMPRAFSAADLAEQLLCLSAFGKWVVAGEQPAQ